MNEVEIKVCLWCLDFIFHFINIRCTWVLYFSWLFKTASLSALSAEVNVSRSQLLFTSLVGVDVQEDQLISQVLQNRLLLPCHGNKAADGPSLLHFMNSDHLREKLVPLKEEPVNYKPRPFPSPADAAFDLHRRGRC